MVKKSVLSVVCMTLILACVTGIALASSSTPYSSYKCTKESTRVGKAAIYKCSCNPVNNYLKSYCNVQYEYENRYYWTGWTSGGASNTNGRYSQWTVRTGGDVNFVQGKFEARCGAGPLKELSCKWPKQ